MDNAGGAGVGEVIVSGCHREIEVGTDGRFSFGQSADGCELSAQRRSGALWSFGSTAAVPGGTEDVEVRLWVADHAPAGLGIKFDIIGAGVVVDAVHSGTPAEASGLQPGDVILAVDGEPTTGMGIEEWHDRAVGEEGTEIELRVLGEGGERSVTLVRHRIE